MTSNEIIIRIDGKNSGSVTQAVGDLSTKYSANYSKFFRPLLLIKNQKIAELVESLET